MDPHWPIINNNIPQYHIQQHRNITPATENKNDTLDRQLQSFWRTQRVESEQTTDFRTHSLPLARIKKIMKSDNNVRMISAETPMLLSKACDMFIQDLTLRSWVSTEGSRRRTLQKSDISYALSTTDLFDFLVDIVPREKVMGVSSATPVVSSTLGGGSGVGFTVGLPMEQAQNEDASEGCWTWLSDQSAWHRRQF